ncbi:MAG: PhnD/SsuA/transferrin family substrate-binding protein [Nitrosomonadales bacterium]
MKLVFNLILTGWFLLAPFAIQADPLRLGITSATARGQYTLLEEWRAYLQQRLDRPVEFVFRESYLESMDLMKQNKLDFAWISSPAYFENSHQMSLLATPLYQGKPFDRSYLIVPSSDHSSQSLLDFKNKVFAYVDPDSGTGYLQPRYELLQQQQNPERFFKKTFFTHDHQKIVAAVAIGMADAGAMSGFAWDSLARSRPDITSQTRIVKRSAKYGFPPIIARNSLEKRDFNSMQRVLIDMNQDPDGIKLLQRLNLDGFIVADKKLYQGVHRMMRRIGDL